MYSLISAQKVTEVSHTDQLMLKAEYKKVSNDECKKPNPLYTLQKQTIILW